MILLKKILKTLCCLAVTIYSVDSFAQSQHEVQQVQEFLTSKDNNGLNAIPSFYAPDSTRGFRYFSRQWLRGAVLYSNDQTNSNREKPLKADNSRFYNFDKFSNKLVSTEDGKNTLNLPNDAVNSFILMDSGKLYTFKKIPEISKSAYFEVMTENDSGYSLYKHIITKLNRADYQNIGYGSTGKKYDEYVDAYEYYIVFPGAKEFKKLSLNTSSIKKALKAEAKKLDEFFEHNPGDVTEQTLYSLILFLNNKTGI